jgi:ribosome-binding ATPase YchF (GTP1/OBG family)
MYSWLSEDTSNDSRIDFFDDFLVPVGEISVQGYNIDTANDFFSYTELDKDLYAIAAMPTHNKCKRRKKREKREEEAQEEKRVVEEVREQFSESQTVQTAVKIDAWQDMLLYALAGLALILILEQVFQLGARSCKT